MFQVATSCVRDHLDVITEVGPISDRHSDRGACPESGVGCMTVNEPELSDHPDKSLDSTWRRARDSIEELADEHEAV